MMDLFSVGTVSAPGVLSLAGISDRFADVTNEIGMAIGGELLRFSEFESTWNSKIGSMLATYTVNRRTTAIKAYAANISTILNADLDNDGNFDADDIDLFNAALASGTTSLLVHNFDFSDLTVDDDDRIALINFYFGTFFGDSDLDGWFDSSDFVIVMQSGEYEDEIVGNSGWEEGDWNGDADFTTGDFQFVFSFGNYNGS